MAKNKQIANKITQSGTRKNRNKLPTMASTGDATIIKYSVLGTTLASDATGANAEFRPYIPGNYYNFTSTAASSIVAAYSAARFMPGTKIRWEPTVSFTTSGRVFVGFTDNPEVIAAFDAASLAASINIVKALGSMISFPVWQETDIPFPTRTRRKMFDTNTTITFTTDNLDRCCQTAMLFCIDGCPASTNVGGFWYHDVVSVEGIHSVVT